MPIDNNYQNAVDLIYNQVHRQDRKIITTGLGKSGFTAARIAATFSSTGTPAAYLHPLDAQHGDIGMIQSGDVILIVSNSGQTKKVIDFVKQVDKLFSKKPIKILICGQTDCPLSEIVDCTLVTGRPKEADSFGLIPTISQTVINVIGDTLVVLMMEKIQFQIEDYKVLHKGGHNGDLLSKL
jgi:arabinose-5-phosphate isomerase